MRDEILRSSQKNGFKSTLPETHGMDMQKRITQSPAHQILEHHRQIFEKTAEAAFLNIQWINTELIPTRDQMLMLKYDTNTMLMLAVSIREIVKYEQSFFMWQIGAYFINITGSRVLRHSELTKKHARVLRNYAHGIALCVNDKKKGSFQFEGAIYKGLVGCSEDDLLVVEAAKLDRHKQKLEKAGLRIEEATIIDEE